jgi:hypothetical protein
MDNDRYPIDILLLPVFLLYRENDPKAVLLLPVLLYAVDAKPDATLPEPVLLYNDKLPMDVLVDPGFLEPLDDRPIAVLFEEDVTALLSAYCPIEVLFVPSGEFTVVPKTTVPLLFFLIYRLLIFFLNVPSSVQRLVFLDLKCP